MANLIMAYLLMAYMVMACIIMACIVMACTCRPRYDWLKIYDGAEIRGAPIAALTGSDPPWPGYFVATSGSMLVVLSSDDVLHKSGIDASFEVEPPPAVVDATPAPRYFSHPPWLGHI